MSKAQSQSLIHPYLERVLRQIILKDLANKGRPTWDKPHTEAVVYWMKYLLVKINPKRPVEKQFNPKVMVTAAYAHDWGYMNIFSQKKIKSIKEVIPYKQQHMQLSVQLIERLIAQRLSSYFTQAEILHLTHIISVHDNVKILKTEAEILLMECDALGMLDVKRVPPTLSPAENKYFMKHSIYERRLPKFIHQEAKEAAEKLIKERSLFYKEAFYKKAAN